MRTLPLAIVVERVRQAIEPMIKLFFQRAKALPL